jgi:hypothetical protein
MAKSKNRKDHKKKVAARNAKIKHETDKYQKFQRDMLMKMIEEEKNKGMFDNMPQIPQIPQVTIEGPSFGPSI